MARGFGGGGCGSADSITNGQTRTFLTLVIVSSAALAVSWKGRGSAGRPAHLEYPHPLYLDSLRSSQAPRHLR